MMKKNILTALLSVSIVSLMAQVKLPDFPNAPRNIGNLTVIEGYNNALNTNSIRASKRVSADTLNKAGYLPPVGTLFLGMDPDCNGTWMHGKNGVIGAWSDTIPCWVWTNNIQGEYSKVEYTNQQIKKYGSYIEDGYYFTDALGNFYDTIVAAGGWSEYYKMGANGNAGYPWQNAIPLQTVTWKNDETEKYMFLTESTDPTTSNAGIAVGGLTCGNTEDGLWPLTQAINVTKEGTSFELLQGSDYDSYPHYFFGTDSLNTDTTSKPYQRTAIKTIAVNYEKPQAPLYIKSISLAVGAQGHSITKPKVKVNKLKVAVIDLLTKDTIASSVATNEDLSDMNQEMKCNTLTFNFANKSEFGEKKTEGFLVRNAFRVEISNFTAEDTLGIYAAKCSLFKSGAEKIYENGDSVTIDYEPYIMLNGIYPTLENYVMQKQFGSFERGVYGDTVDINMVSVNNPNYCYQAYYNAKDLAEASTFEYFSTFAPYDSVSRVWNMDLEYPDYIILGADYDTNWGTDDDPINLWDYARCFDLYIYATSTPKIGDSIKISKAGREAIFRIVSIDGGTDIEDVYAIHNGPSTQKILDANGRVNIKRGNTTYSILGQKIF